MANSTNNRSDMHNPKFYIGSLDTRWHVYPQRQPLVAVAHDCRGYWALTPDGQWYRAPVSYCLNREVTEAEALAFHHETQMPVADAVAELEAVGAHLVRFSDSITVKRSASASIDAALDMMAVHCGSVQSASVWRAIHRIVTRQAAE